LVPKKAGAEDLPLLINVCATLEDMDTRKREISGLKEAASELGLSCCFIITLDEEETLNLERLNGSPLEIKIIPYWKWCFDFN